ncbi:hypothetical protein COLO4_33087 [Corchorus olitorius]|uniref:Uncharacterized protein n=1 Tax=Corchorus olitorius TaxID=93759 RepID=A0A1R3GWL4_9ROSI|nr:hypothetical protein COLO4_33087 [Corchorus olitorius]
MVTLQEQNTGEKKSIKKSSIAMEGEHQGQGKEETLPPGLRFHPTAEEIITYYVVNKDPMANAYHHFQFYFHLLPQSPIFYSPHSSYPLALPSTILSPQPSSSMPQISTPLTTTQTRKTPPTLPPP